jgi:hypothetical protein
VLWERTLRTGSWASDQQALEQLRAYAASQGAELSVQPLPEGGFRCVAFARSAPLAAHGCQTCRRQAPTRYVEFRQNIGVLIMRFQKVMRGNLCRRCISKYFWEYTLITAAAGWWGVISFFYTLYILPANTITFLGASDLKDT